jgi:hypothetical protein
MAFKIGDKRHRTRNIKKKRAANRSQFRNKLTDPRSWHRYRKDEIYRNRWTVLAERDLRIFVFPQKSESALVCKSLG